ncbi:MAG: hypothetical protein FWH29_01140 [Methanobrevibacter sp.]|nr:hypothetical protein [Methanobrevibacter sp.]
MKSINRSKEEIKHAKLVLKWARAKTPQEKKLSMEELVHFEKKHPKLVDDIQNRRWINYGDGSI